MDGTPSSAAHPWLLGRLCLVLAAALPCGAALAQPYLFRCVDADGSVEFSDRACESDATPATLQKPGDAGLNERKNQNDARLQRDNALIRQYQAERQAEEEALRAIQARQLEIAAEITRRLARERETKNSARSSALPSSTCDLCRTPGAESYWPGYIR